MSQRVIESNQNSNIANTSLNRSKSELDLSGGGDNASTNSSSSRGEKQQQQQQQHQTSSRHSSNMFGFFTRKRRSKSKSSLYASQSNLAVTSSSCDTTSTNPVTPLGLSLVRDDFSNHHNRDEENPYGKYSSAYVSTMNLSKTKKRVAPPPPPTNNKSTPINNQKLR